MNSVPIGVFGADLPPSVASLVDAIVTFDKNPPLWAEWALVAVFVAGVLALAWAATRSSSPSETLNERAEREMQEVRR